MKAKELLSTHRREADTPNGHIIYYPMLHHDMEILLKALCREFNGYLIDKYAEDPTLIPMIDDVIDEFMKEKL